MGGASGISSDTADNVALNSSTDSPSGPRTTPEIISPDSAHINPIHVRPVVQPGEETTPNTNTSPESAQAMNFPTTNAPATNAAAAVSPNGPAEALATKMTGPRTSVPSTITTLSGKTYTGCILSRVTPDGIAIINSTGGADIRFSDLDPSFGTVFGYDPVAGQKYEQEQAEATHKIAPGQAPVKVVESSTTDVSNPPTEPTAAPSQAFAAPKLSPEDRAAIQAQIRALNSDIAFMQREEDKVANSNNSSHGGYFDKIAAERDQVAQLQHELSQ